MLHAEREQVAAAARRLAAEGLVRGTAGNLSARSGELAAISPTGAVLGELTAEQVVVVDSAGAVVDGQLAPTSEIALHLGAYRRYEAGAVVHTHAPAATALGCVIEELPIIHYGMLCLGGPVRVAPYATFGTEELACVALDALTERSAVLLSNHGTLTIGSDMAQAAENTMVLEWACEMYSRAAAVGRPRVLGEADVAAFRRQMTETGYGGLREARR